MELFEIEGETSMGWRMMVMAEDRTEALDGIRDRIGMCLDIESSPVRITRLKHRVTRCKASEAA